MAEKLATRHSLAQEVPADNHLVEERSAFPDLAYESEKERVVGDPPRDLGRVEQTVVRDHAIGRIAERLDGASSSDGVGSRPSRPR